jgi:hypothetical protein
MKSDRVFSTLAMVVAAAAFAHADAPRPLPDQTVRARRFELVDAQGRVVGTLTSEHGPRLMLYDEKGRHRVALALHGGEAPGLELFTPEGGHAVQLRHLNDEAMLALDDSSGRERFLLKVAGSPPRASASFFDASGVLEAILPSGR